MARRTARLVALPAVLIHLAGTVGVYLHFALVTHERCPVHGELIHSDPDASPTEMATFGAHAGGGASDVSLLRHGRESTEDEHDICSTTAALRERAVEPSSILTARVSPPRELARPRALPPPPHSARDGYRVAPKTSPPARA